MGLEHCKQLGDSVEKICADKAGIIRPNTPAVVGPTVPLDVVQSIAEERSSKLIRIEPDDNKSFLVINKEISLAIYKEVVKNELDGKRELSQQDLDYALNANPPCRMEEISQESIRQLHPSLDYYPRKTYMDVGHNEPALKHLLQAIGILEKNSK